MGTARAAAPAEPDEAPDADEAGSVEHEAAAAPAPELTKEEKQALLNGTYTEASKILRDRHRDEFNELRVKLAAAKGITWRPEPTAAEKAKAEIEAKLKEFPELAEQLGINQPAPRDVGVDLAR